jgi:hypothetical protein
MRCWRGCLYAGRGRSIGLRESLREEPSTDSMLPYRYTIGLKRGVSDVAAWRSTSSLNYSEHQQGPVVRRRLSAENITRPAITAHTGPMERNFNTESNVCSPAAVGEK